MKELLSIDEFLLTTGLDQVSLLNLLAIGSIPFVKSEFGELRIDVSNLDSGTLTRESLRQIEQTSPESQIPLEEVASTLVSNMQGIVEDAFELALYWIEREQSRPEEENS